MEDKPTPAPEPAAEPAPVTTIYSGDPTHGVDPSVGATLVSHDPAEPAVEPTSPPVVVDAPYVSQEGALLNCTMGNWVGEPTTRSYQWRREGIDVYNAVAPTHPITVDDVGYSFDCTMTATNSAGTSEVVTSNVIVVVSP